MSHYHDPADRKYLKELATAAPDAHQSFAVFNEMALGRDEAEIPKKYRELIAIGVALTTQCPYCIEIHTRKAREAGATEAEIAETVMVSAALRAGAAVVHGTHCLE
jgi:AhpD family alkylhydroperoxidase